MSTRSLVELSRQLHQQERSRATPLVLVTDAPRSTNVSGTGCIP